MAVDGLYPPASSTQTTTDASAESEYIADRYDGLTVGPGLTYTFETQAGVPYDGTNRMARKLSPFTLRLVVPEALLPDDSRVDVNLIGRGVETTITNQMFANDLRRSIGLATVSDSEEAGTVLTNLNATLSAGRVLQTTMGTEARSVLADNVTVADIQYQVEKMLQTPPLTLFVNPSEMSVSYTAVQQFTQRTRYGYVFERWGESQPKLSISGSTGAWCAGIDPGSSIGGASGFQVNETDVPTGVQFASKRNSAAFQQFISLYHIFRNNGYIYDTIGKSEAMLFIGAVAIDYDQMTYVGNINTFEYSYDENNPHRIEWSMEFTVGRMYDHAEEPLIVLPLATPTPGPGSFSSSELAAMMAGTPGTRDISGGPMSFLGLSGTEQFTGDADAVPGDPDSTTPLEALGAFFTPTGTFESGFTD